jgi:hypothetical protein
MRNTNFFASGLIAASLALCVLPSLANAQCNGGRRGSGGSLSGMGSMGLGQNAGMGMGSGMGMNPMMMQQQLQAMQQQMMQMQMVQQALLDRLEQMGDEPVTVSRRTRSSVRTADSSHKKTGTRRAHRRSKPKSTAGSDDTSSLAANERPARSARPASE